MRRTRAALAVMCVLILAAGCGTGTTYCKTFTLSTYAHSCREVTTTDTDVLSDLAALGYAEGTCAAEGYSGTTCVISGTGSDGTSYTITEYYKGDYYTESVISSTCTAEDGTL